MSETPPRGKRRRTEESDTEGSGSVIEAGKSITAKPLPISEDTNGRPEPMTDAGESSVRHRINLVGNGSDEASFV